MTVKQLAAAGGSSAHHAAQAHAHQPHHLKYGNIIASGFAPDDSDDEQDDPIEDETFSGGSTLNTTASTSSAPRDAASRRYRNLERLDASSRELHSTRRYLFRRPRALQYFRGNTLVRSSAERSSHRLELFFDLVFVGLIATLAEEAIHEHTWGGIVRYVLTYTAAWMVWNYMREVFNAFFVDDLPQRVLVLGVMACLVVFGNNAPNAEELHEESGARATAIGTYLLAGGMVFSVMTAYSFYICQYRIQIRAQATVWLILLTLWISSIFVSTRTCIAMVSIALVLEYASWLFFYSPLFKRLAKLRYSSAVAIEHEIDRFTDFVTLVHGEFLYSVLSGQPVGTGLHSGVARTLLTVVIAFVLHGMYCTGAGSRRITHPIRRSMWHALPYFGLHLPLVSAITLCGDATAELVKENEVAQGVRWIFAGSYAVGVVCMTLLVMLETEHDDKGELYFSKAVRIAPRFVAAIVVALLPLADQERVNSTALLGAAAALGGGAWMWQELGSLDGPNAAWYQKGQVQGAEGQEETQAGRRTWKGFPTLVEPGAWIVDSTRQRGRSTTFEQESRPAATATEAADEVHTSHSKLSDV